MLWPTGVPYVAIVTQNSCHYSIKSQLAAQIPNTFEIFCTSLKEGDKNYIRKGKARTKSDMLSYQAN